MDLVSAFNGVGSNEAEGGEVSQGTQDWIEADGVLGTKMLSYGCGGVWLSRLVLQLP